MIHILFNPHIYDESWFNNNLDKNKAWFDMKTNTFNSILCGVVLNGWKLKEPTPVAPPDDLEQIAVSILSQVDQPPVERTPSPSQSSTIHDWLAGRSHDSDDNGTMSTMDTCSDDLHLVTTNSWRLFRRWGAVVPRPQEYRELHLHRPSGFIWLLNELEHIAKWWVDVGAPFHLNLVARVGDWHIPSK